MQNIVHLVCNTVKLLHNMGHPLMKRKLSSYADVIFTCHAIFSEERLRDERKERLRRRLDKSAITFCNTCIV